MHNRSHLHGVPFEKPQLEAEVEPPLSRRPQIAELVPLLPQLVQRVCDGRHGTTRVHLQRDAVRPASIIPPCTSYYYMCVCAAHHSLHSAAQLHDKRLSESRKIPKPRREEWELSLPSRMHHSQKVASERKVAADATRYRHTIKYLAVKAGCESQGKKRNKAASCALGVQGHER